MLIDNEMYWCHCGTGFGDEKDFAYHYADCNKFDQAWLTKADLIKKPVLCDKCGDKGLAIISRHRRNEFNEGYWVDINEPCPCRDNPQSMYNFFNGGVI
jgi:hypothetical protein